MPPSRVAVRRPSIAEILKAPIASNASPHRWQIGKLMKAGRADEAAAQKKEVDRANEIAASAEEELNKV